MTSSKVQAKRPIVGHPVPVKLNFLDLGLLELSDLALTMNVANEFGRRVSFDGTPPESTLEHPDEPLVYRVVDGALIAKHLPKIMNLYREVIPEIILNHIGLEICPSRFERSSITLNLLEGCGARYELHEDSNSVTGLLFANTLSPKEGGTLRFYYPDRAPLDIQPEEGVFLLFDARWVPHEVLALQEDAVRLSLPMNYFLPTDIEIRPEFLDSYIFGE